MAEPAVSPELLVNLTAALESLKRACRLPSGWQAKPSFRLSENGASLLVVWKPATAASDKSPRKTNKRRSKSSRQRSAARAAAHSGHKQQQSATSRQQQLSGSAPPFFMPAPPPPNSVPAVESERGGAAEESSRGSNQIVEVASEPQAPALTESGPQQEGHEMGVDSRGKRGREGELTIPTAITTPPDRATLLHSLMQTMLAEYERNRGRRLSEQLQAAMFAVDSLAGRGAGETALYDYENRIRPGLIRRGS
jgi:hypothetical protein